jgi:hypothetical protein
MKMDTLEDLFEIDHEKLKAAENKRVITRIKQLLKADGKEERKAEANAEANAEEMPYEGVSVVGNKKVTLKFDLKTKEARVVDVKVDPRDTRGRNHMARYFAEKKLLKLAKEQKDKDNE